MLPPYSGCAVLAGFSVLTPQPLGRSHHLHLLTLSLCSHVLTQLSLRAARRHALSYTEYVRSKLPLVNYSGDVQHKLQTPSLYLVKHSNYPPLLLLLLKWNLAKHKIPSRSHCYETYLWEGFVCESGVATYAIVSHIRAGSPYVDSHQ